MTITRSLADNCSMDVYSEHVTCNVEYPNDGTLVGFQEGQTIGNVISNAGLLHKMTISKIGMQSELDIPTEEMNNTMERCTTRRQCQGGYMNKMDYE